MIDSVKTVNNFCSNVCSMKDIATTTVPRVIKVSDGAAGNVLIDLLI